MTHGVTWQATDLTGGPIDDVLAALRKAFADLSIERLTVTHSADDKNVWFITRSSGSSELQIDSMPVGSPPFLLESESERGRAEDAETAIEILIEWLR